MLCSFHVSRIKRWFLSKTFTTYIEQREEIILAMLIKNVTIQVSSMGSLTVSASGPNYHAFVWFCVGIMLKLSFKKDSDMTLQVFTKSF